MRRRGIIPTWGAQFKRARRFAWGRLCRYPCTVQQRAAQPLSRPFLVVAVANFLYFLNFAFFFLLPVWVLQHGGAEETAGRVVGTAGIAGPGAGAACVGWPARRGGA